MFLLQTDVVQKFASICYYCGDSDDLCDNEQITELRKQYSIVRPICNSCHATGLLPNVRNAMKVNQNKKQKK